MFYSTKFKLLLFSVALFFNENLFAQAAPCSPTFSEIYDFEIGDVFHYSIIDRKDDHDGSTLVYNKESIEIIDKKVSTDTTFYYRKISNRKTIFDTLILVDNGFHTLHACDSDLVRVNDYLHPFFTDEAIDSTDLYAKVSVVNNDTTRSWRNDHPRIVKAIYADGYGEGFYTQTDSNTYEPFDTICESLTLEYAAGAGLIFEEHFCFESGFYRILINKTNGSDTVTFATASVENHTIKPLHLTVFPNPVKDKLIVHFDGNTNVNYSITNTMGQVVTEGQTTSSEHTINVIDLPIGIYILITENAKSSGSVRFIKE